MVDVTVCRYSDSVTIYTYCKPVTHDVISTEMCDTGKFLKLDPLWHCLPCVIKMAVEYYYIVRLTFITLCSKSQEIFSEEFTLMYSLF